jgi:putative transcriptional regulator
MLPLDFTQFIPTQGSLLISEPFMKDPNFKRSVMLLASHNEEESVGFVLNCLMELKLEQVLDHVKRMKI